MFARRSRFLGTLALAHDAGVTALAFFLAYWVRVHVWQHVVPWRQLTPLAPIGEYWGVFLAAVLGWPLIGYALGVYRDFEISTPIRLVGNVVKLVGTGLLVTYAGLHLTRSEIVSRSLVLIVGLVDLVLLALGRWLFFSGTAWVRDRLGCFHSVLIVGTGPKARALATLIEEEDTMGLRLVGFVDPEAASPKRLNTAHADYPVMPSRELAGALRRHVVDEVIFAVALDQLPALQPLMRDCAREGVDTRLHLEFAPGVFSRVYLERLRGVPLLSFAATPDSELLLFAKRLFDLVVSGLALIILSPLLLAIALLVKLTSPGPILYRQVRSGLNGRRFTLYKFRSMVANAEELRPHLQPLNELKGPVFKISQDPRCTPVGRWLRRSSLDELPQLWNIFRGEMSFVGPRPALPEEVDQYEAWQRRRLRMRPGLTCTWVLEGRNQVDFERLIQLDLSYIDNWSLWLDLKISLKTIPLVLLGKGAY